MIPDDIINQILDRVNIVDIVSGYISLKRAGRNFRANCPFHHEKTPSFMVSPDKQIFHCFGCGAGGNVFGFLMKYERMEFPEAVELLASRVGIQLPKWQSAPANQVSDAVKIHSANELALKFYQNLLNSQPGSQARAYLKKRGIKDEYIAKVRLGYAPNEWDTFLNHAKKKGLDTKTLENAGLVIPGKEASFYDRFRHRIIFPIFNTRGRAIGFGARVLDQGLPKYINSPETLVYNKGSNLYGLNLAIEHIKQKDFVIIVEGYLDFLMPYQSGIGNIVASSGTAITVEQIRLLKRFTKNVTMVFDPDSAGEAASLRGLDLAVSEGLNVKVVALPSGYDPDSFVRDNGADKFLEKINAARDFFDYKFQLLCAKYPNSNVETKAKIANEMLQTIARLPNAIVKTEYMKRLAADLDVELPSLWAEIKKIKADREIYSECVTVSHAGALTKNFCINNAEKMLLGLILEDPGLICRVKNNFKNTDAEEQSDFKFLFGAVCDFWDKNKTVNIAKLIGSIKEDTHSRIVLDAYATAQNIIDKDKCLEDCIKNIKQSNVKDKMKHLQDKIKTAQTEKDEEYLLRLLSEYNHLMRQKAGCI